MKVIEVGGTIAIVNDTEMLKQSGLQFIEIDENDSQCIIKNKPAYQQQLQAMFSDVMAMFGIRIAPPTVQIGEESRNLSLELNDTTGQSGDVNAA